MAPQRAYEEHPDGWPLSAGSYARGCRCAECRAARRIYYRRVYQRKRAEYLARTEKWKRDNPELVAAQARRRSSRLVAARSVHPEGKPVSSGTYTDGCRCDGCSGARSAYMQARRERANELRRERRLAARRARPVKEAKPRRSDVELRERANELRRKRREAARRERPPAPKQPKITPERRLEQRGSEPDQPPSPFRAEIARGLRAGERVSVLMTRWGATYEQVKSIKDQLGGLNG